MVCRSCRAEHRGDASFCGSCGAVLTSRQGGRQPGRALVRYAIILCLLMGGLVGLITIARYSSFGQGLAGLFWPASTPQVIAVDSLVQGIQGMSQLATAKYTIQTIVAVESRGRFGPLTKDRILLRANADVFAGIDLGAIESNQVKVEGTTVTITLPAPAVISSDITYQVYDRDRGLFAPTNKDLQSLAEQQARADILKTVCEKGILEEAQRNTEVALRSFVLSLGFKEVHFVTTRPSPGQCAS